ncbi:MULTISPECIES: hypothetical protein [Burkholderia cepacia complex]|uniref:hypothetical protein n=1 Tax=Burkholderia cepacia complex TaxID=87882 RepID=UPI0000E99302|nr:MULTISPECIES: hypothetical protein [Burkholderia cepacia complex]
MQTWKELKDSPIWIIATVIFATIGATATFYEHVLVPDRVEHDAKIASAAQIKAAEDAAASEIRVASEAAAKEIRLAREGAASEVSAARAEESAERDKLHRYELEHLFVDNSPYPLGLNNIHIGDPVDLIEHTYPPEMIDKSALEDGQDFIVVKNVNSVFRATYYFDGADRKKSITHIGFMANSITDFPKMLLHDRFTQMFGQPVTNRIKNRFEWDTKIFSVFQSDTFSFLVTAPGTVPAYW